MLAQIRDLDPKTNNKEIINRAKAVLEHRFDNHIYCSIDWCYNLQARSLQQRHTKPKTGGYYTKAKENECYLALKSALEPFMKKELLVESMHDMSTQNNEALNNSIAHLCPKTKHLSSTHTILTRVAIAVCYCNMGFGQFYKLLLENQLHVDTTPMKNIERLDQKIISVMN